MTAAALEIVGITRHFGRIRANDSISFAIAPGEMLGLLGENGAGKSTLLSILAGFDRAEAGTVRVDGAPVPPHSTARAIARGISLVHQHFSLVPTFTVAEQLRLSGWKGGSLPGILGDGIGRETRIDDLGPGQRQRVELAKALLTRPRVLLLDEPTSILAPPEAAALFETIGRLRRDGTAVVFVTHKMHEVLDHADRIVVLRRGRVSGQFGRTGDGWPAGIERHLLAAMFGSSADGVTTTVPAPPSPAPAAARRIVLHASGVRAASKGGGPPLRDIDLSLHEGETRAVVGVDGQGQGVLADVLAGYEPSAGRIEIDGRVVEGGPAAFAAAGVGFITGERVRDGGIGSFPVRDNLVLTRQRSARFSWHGLLRASAIDASAREAIASWKIQPPDPSHPYGALSGGNMQKVVVARALAAEPRILIAVNALAGLDVQTAGEVRRRVGAFAAGGGAVVWFTNDLDDAATVAGSVSVMFEGRLSPPMRPVGAAFERAAGMMASGWSQGW